MLIGSCQKINGKCLNLFLNNSALNQVSCTKYLGVFFDHHLTWESHIIYVLQTVRRKLFVIKLAKTCCP